MNWCMKRGMKEEGWRLLIKGVNEESGDRTRGIGDIYLQGELRMDADM